MGSILPLRSRGWGTGGHLEALGLPEKDPRNSWESGGGGGGGGVWLLLHGHCCGLAETGGAVMQGPSEALSSLAREASRVRVGQRGDSSPPRLESHRGRALSRQLSAGTPHSTSSSLACLASVSPTWKQAALATSSAKLPELSLSSTSDLRGEEETVTGGQENAGKKASPPPPPKHTPGGVSAAGKLTWQGPGTVGGRPQHAPATERWGSLPGSTVPSLGGPWPTAEGASRTGPPVTWPSTKSGTTSRQAPPPRGCSGTGAGVGHQAQSW